MKFVARSLFSLLLPLSACGERAGAPPPQVEAKAADAGTNDVKGVTVARATDAGTGADAKAPEVEPAGVKPIAAARAPDVTAADATPPDADPAVAVVASAPPGAGTTGVGFYWAEAAKGAARMPSASSVATSFATSSPGVSVTSIEVRPRR
jgi:hypothetical protein